MTKKMIGVILGDYISEDLLEGSIKNIVGELSKFQDKYASLYEDIQIVSSYDYDGCLEYHLEGMRLETKEEYRARLDKQVRDKEWLRNHKIRQLEQLKKELGEE